MTWRSIVGAIAGLVLWWVLFLVIYAGTEHYILLWDKLPAWYNLIVPLVIAGSVWLGGRTCRVAGR